MSEKHHAVVFLGLLTACAAPTIEEPIQAPQLLAQAGPRESILGPVLTNKHKVIGNVGTMGGEWVPIGKMPGLRFTAPADGVYKVYFDGGVLVSMMGEVSKYGFDGTGVWLRVANPEGGAEIIKPYERMWKPNGDKYDGPGSHTLHAEMIVRLKAGVTYTFRFEARIDNRHGSSGITFFEDARLIAEPL